MMKQTLHFILTLSALLLLTACGASDNEVEMIPVQLNENAAWSFITPDGKIVLDGELKNEPSVVIGGVFSVREKDGIALYTIDDGKAQPINGAGGLICCGAYSDGLIPIVRPKERITIIDRNGKTVFTLDPVKEKEIVSCAPMFSDGLLAITDENGKVGYVDTKGKVAVEPAYDEGGAFSEGLAWVCNKAAGNPDAYIYSLIDKTGKVINTFKEDCTLLGVFRNGLMAAEKGGACGFVNQRGVFTRLPKAVECIIDYNERFVIYLSNGKCGVMTIAGKAVIKNKYNDISFHGDDLFLARNGYGEYDLLDTKGLRVQIFDDHANVFSLHDYFDSTNFAFIGGDYGDYSLLSDKFAYLTRDPFCNFGYNVSLSPIVTSDHSGANTLASQVVSYIEKNAIGGITLGESGANFLKDEPREADNDMFPFSNAAMYERIAHDGPGYHIRAYAITNDTFCAPADKKAPNTPDDTSAPYRWNLAAQADRLALGVRTDAAGSAADLHTNIEKLLEQKGFKTTFRRPGLSVLKQGTIGIAVMHKKGDRLTRIYMLLAPQADWYAEIYSANDFGYAQEADEGAAASATDTASAGKQ